MYGRPRIVKAPSAPSRYLLANTATDDNPAYIAYLNRLSQRASSPSAGLTSRRRLSR